MQIFRTIILTVSAIIAVTIPLPVTHAAELASTAASNNGLALWAKIHDVFSHPRCANCHVGSDNIPIWSGKNFGEAARPHGMNINGGASRIGAESGLLCTACHTPHNSALNNGPPGNVPWLLAPVEMQWYGKSSAEICAQVKDKKRNGNRTIEALAHHVEADPLVNWGWSPGPGRDPAPYTSADTAAAIRAWEKVGAPCPK